MKYEKPELEVLLFRTNDVIRTSDDVESGGSGDNENDNWTSTP